MGINMSVKLAITMIKLDINSNIIKKQHMDIQHQNSAHPETSHVDCDGVQRHHCPEHHIVHTVSYK